MKIKPGTPENAKLNEGGGVWRRRFDPRTLVAKIKKQKSLVFLTLVPPPPRLWTALRKRHGVDT